MASTPFVLRGGPRGDLIQQPAFYWTCIFGGMGAQVIAPTKSEARAEIKMQLGRIPAGVAIRKVK